MSTLPLRQLTPQMSVSSQLRPENMAQVAAAGFKSVINNRPDFEEGPGQPTNASIEQSAVAAGLQYRHQPVGPNYQSAEEIEAFASLLDELPQPVLAFCRSGTRSARLFAASKVA